MSTTRRVGAGKSKTRATLLDCTERLMLDEGYAAVTYRNVAAKAGVTPGLVQYYFPALDDLFLALIRDRTEVSLSKLAADLRRDHPLRAVWNYANDRASAALIAELMALGNHRKQIQDEIAEGGRKARELALAALAGTSKDYAFREVASPDVLVFLMTSTPRMIVMEEAAGIATAHAETVDYIERYLDHVEPR
ncbi:TetR/AcrR family transcriptional regulator [Yinghuangia sp. ASG 101]|uniref:TetR/AcrR family transcriptional regulator n=1 Tax=Yinghuangia sp. ASG 101 TaxID=2896848 RepID=UPI001E482068|nr:TetR/AcrR family transcriptional regulator [Yinghuangia sp. ASG 101]UGQ11012.1 TetR/AcrR family transcriptional regulator [Yinghuangia sp. ASG 101]